MKRYLPLCVMAGLFAGASGLTACNDDNSSSPYDNSAEFAVMVNSFSLKSDDSILANLDSVYFTIDLNNATIFNADSLPLGTRVDSLGVAINYSAASKAEITMPNAAGTADTVVDFLTNSAQAINFSRGYVTFHIESANKLSSRDYRIYVNVHKMKPDSLAWGSAEWSAYPTSISAPTALKAVEFKKRALCFATDGSAYTRAISSNPGLNDWATESIALPAGLDVNSITASDDALYALADGNKLMRSTDDGSNWTDLNTSMTHIYGGYGTSILGVAKAADGTFNFVTYPATQAVPAPQEAPVAATSQAVTFVSEWADDPMLLVTGGLTASGDCVDGTWAYDGEQWANIALDPLPAASGMILVPYFTYKVGSNWYATKRTALVAFGGKQSDGVLNREVYLSFDRGMHWQKASELMQLPAGVPSLCGAQALVFEQTLTSGRSRALSSWTATELPLMPAWLTPLDAHTGVRPITSWECPYIYLFGGQTQFASVNTDVWRGVINRLAFKPLQ